jgi:hypothetical protein
MAGEEAAMSWDFETEPEFGAKLDWADAFVRKRWSRLTSSGLTWCSLRHRDQGRKGRPLSGDQAVAIRARHGPVIV